ncbi:tyrosine-protein kinase family protein [Armatimonas sp.]|uniref:tyrosine-protein kinase family protein n=1 Tax=Armatimonas sp. TaxID=1872638 RepID=UPI00374FFA99
MMRIPGIRARRLESAEKVKKELGLTLLAELPPPTKGAAMLAAAYTHLLQETLLRVAPGEAQRTTLAVTSTRQREGRTAVAANLAIAAARAGRSVLLVDTEVRNPQLHRIFGGDFAISTPGLVDLLAGAVSSPSEVLLDTSVPGVRLLPIGDVEQHNAAELFSSPRLERFIRSIAPRLADLVIFDTPHVRSDEPGRYVLTHVDGVLFTVGLGETEVGAARKALGILERNQVTVLGGVFMTSGDYPQSMSVALPEITLQKLEEDAEIQGVLSPIALGEPIKVMPFTAPNDDSAASENEADGISMNVATALKKDDDNSVVPASGFGVEDLEAVLQGWRRRDGAAAPEVAEAPEPTAFAMPLPPMFEAPTQFETSSHEDAPAGITFPMGELVGGGAGIPIGIPFLSVDTNQDEPQESTLEKPLLTLVESNSEYEEAQELDGSQELAEVPVLEEIPATEILAAEVEEPVFNDESEAESAPVIPAFPVPIMAVETPVVLPTPEPAPVVVAVVQPVVVEPIAVVPVAPASYAPTPAPSWPAAPVVVAPAPPVAVVTAPVFVAPEPIAAPAFPSAQTFAPVITAPPTPAATSLAPLANRAALDMQIDMFQTGPGEMTMRAATSNAPAVGYPPISLELAMAMNAMRGMRAITPSSTGGVDQPRIALEAVSTDAPDATRMRMVVGSTHEPSLEVVVHNGAGISVRTGTGHEQPVVKLDSQNLPDGGTITRATLYPARGGQELVLELRREPVNDGFTDARWRSRLSLFA